MQASRGLAHGRVCPSSSAPSTSGRHLASVCPDRGLVSARAIRTSRPPPPPVEQEHPVERAFLCYGVPTSSIERAERLEPALLDYRLERVWPMLDLLLDLGLTGSDLGKVLITNPRVFQLSPEHHARPVVDFLRHDIGLDTQGLRALVTRFPAVLGMNVQGQLRPQLAYLNSLGLCHDTLAELVLSRPLVLGPGIETVTNFLRRCGVPRAQMGRLIRSYPIDYKVHWKGIQLVVPGFPDSSSSSGL
ncbi:hypothetical protein HYH03_008942 [Edaphochlamys debaryana]|uniref:Uncharacterized protein n=1 Tax=Edaphochlamys debaryana TaxID=47281 RepID=A0A835XYX0_9CHLO|nr:hypothetical protein HYH03_008942 [Edaphochlamys debaryana]|eukprot:KAG2492781.1 hypothetical protein HYH03_008942 [Edaphochlamys debaryana]